MKVFILAGGFGTRLSEYTESIPKPMVKIGDKPMVWHIMNIYAQYGHTDFYVASGYKAEVIKEYFLNYSNLNSDFSVNLKTGEVEYHLLSNLNWNVTLVQTGIDTMTGGRIKRLGPYIKNDTFLLTYGDGVANINIDELIKFHKQHGKMVTVSAVRPSARFGELLIENGSVERFKEKPQMKEGWINGGFFVMEPAFLDLIDDDQTVLEKDPLEKAAAMGELMAFEHNGFWQCMDTKRDRDNLEKLYASGDGPWSD